MKPTKQCPKCREIKPVGAYNFGKDGNCNKCTKNAKEYQEGYFKPARSVEEFIFGKKEPRHF